MATQVYECRMYGITMKYIQTESGKFLYEQKRHLKPETWTKQVINGLRKAGFSFEDVNTIMRTICNQNYYYNRSFYKPVCDTVREQIELTC